MRKAVGTPYADIVRSIQQALYSGKYKDTTGIAIPQEVNQPKFFRTKSGEAYGFVTKDGRIYIDPEIAGADTPIHEYTHLWARALRQSDMKAWQRVLAQENERVRMMGSKTDKKKANIAKELEGHELSPEQQAVVDVYTGAKDNQPITIQREDGERRVIMRQGNERGAGSKHSLFGHYETTEGIVTTDDILKIPDVIAKGDRKPVKRGNVNLNQYRLTDENGVRYTVVTEQKNNKEIFNDFYTN